ncbi:sesquiterpene synthase, partial [Quercus suber]
HSPTFLSIAYKYHGLEGFLHHTQKVHREQILSYHSKLRLLLELRKKMSIQVSRAPSQNAKSEVVRRIANFHPNIWGDRHLSQQLGLIDALQRLGVAYHFEREIQEALEHIYTAFNDKNDVDDLYKVSLSFQLLRQEGFKISCDVFNKFKDEDGQFKESLTSNVEGMLAFYEATHLRVHGEDILDAALEFTTTHLKSIASLIGNPLAAQITRALKQPLHKGIPRLEARRYISVYEQDASHNKVLLKLSILDFNLMKRLVRAYFDEAKWFHQNYIPTMEEYMHVALKTSGYPMLTAISFLGMGDIVTKEAFDWIFSNPKIITASSVIGRLMDDMKSHKFEQERGHAASAVECYMKQHGVSEQVVHDELNRQVANAWKDINEECIRPTVVPMPLLMRVLNLARVIDVIYKEGDGYTHVGKEMKDNVASVLIDPIPI